MSRDAAPSLLKLPKTHPRLRSKAQYEKALKKLQRQLLSLQQAFAREGHRGVVVIEGRDAAGKGGVVKRLAECVDPRGLRVHPIGPPTPEELAQHYLGRFMSRLPKPGRIAVFDRSWYGRLLVERVEALTPAARLRQAYAEINAFEKALVQDGMRVVKLFLSIDPEVQAARFEERLASPVKHWKLTASDLRARSQWHAYTEAIELMFGRTHTREAPWTLLPANHKWYARVQALDAIVEGLRGELSLKPARVDAAFAARARAELAQPLLP